MAEKIIPAGAELLQLYDTLFGISKNVARQIPNIRDGLKPVQRKILYTMNEIGKPDDTKKVGSIIGEVLKIYSHGDASVTDALIRMATTWGNIAPYLVGVGNFGCHCDQTEVLTESGWKFFKDITYEDKLCSIHPYSGRVIYETPTNIADYEYDGDMYYVDYQMFNFMVTPNHRMLTRGKNAVNFTEAKDLSPRYHLVSLFQPMDMYWRSIKSIATIMDSRISSKPIVLGKKQVGMDHTSIVPYTGHVYCAEVPTYHTLVTRRYGKILLSGNSPMGDAPAAARYIEAKLSPFARQCFFTDKLCIDMVPTYDNTKMEPETLPAMFPTVIINGATGSGFGASTNIPQYNLRDVIETTIKLIDNPNASIKLIPDSQWGCDIMSAKPFGKYKNTFDQIFETGYGSYIQRFRYQIDHQANKVIVTALPAKVPLEGILKEIERLQNENKAFPEVKSVIDLSGKDHGGGIWVEFQLYEGKNPYRLISKLESVTDMKKTVKVNVDLVDGLEVKHYSIRSYILTWYQYRHDYIRSCISTELTNVDSDIAINDIKLFIFGEDRLEKTTDIYVNSVDTDDIIKKLMREYSKSTGMTSQQASILAGMSGKDYTKSALKKYKELKVTLQERHDELTRTIQDPNGINDIIKDQLKSGLKFAKPRAAKIIGASEAVVDDRVVVAIQPATKQIAKLPIGDDSSLLLDSLPANLCIEIDTSYNAIIFDNKGKYIVINPGEIPMMNNLSSMVPVNRYIDKPLSTPIAIAAMDDDCKNFLIITKLGKIKKINPMNYKNRIKENVYITIEDDDEVVSIIGLKSDNSDIFVYTDKGYAQRFPSSIVSVTSQSAMGQYGLAAPEGEVITGAFSVKPSDLIACITKQGYIRINNMKAFPNRKTKNKWEHFIHTVNNDKLLFVISCTASDVLHIVYSNLTTADIPVKNIGVETFGMPPKPIAKADKLTVINVKKTKAKKQN